MARKRKKIVSMVWDSERTPLLPGEQIEFSVKKFKTVPNRLKFTTKNRLITPSIVEAFRNLNQDGSSLLRKWAQVPKMNLGRLTRQYTRLSDIESLYEEAKSELAQIGNLIEKERGERSAPTQELTHHLRSEILAIYQDIGPVSRRGYGELEVLIRDVTLENIVLGDLKVCLNLNNGNLTAYPDDPYNYHYANGRTASGYFHPHITSDGTICLGTAKEPIDYALSNKLLYEVFYLMKRHLFSYDPGDAYCNLNAWQSEQEPCEDCGRLVDQRHLYSCFCPCDHRLQICDNCVVTCSCCGRTFCEECITTCDRCDDFVCDDCLDDNNLCRRCQAAL